MRYNPPPGQSDPNAPFINGIPGVQKGSPVPAEAVEYVQREIINVIEAAGLSPTNTDLTQLTQAIMQLAPATGNNDSTPLLSLIWSTLGVAEDGYLDISQDNGLLLRSDYPDAWDKISAAALAGSTAVVSESTWQSEKTANDGVCGKYSTGDGTTTFRVPLIPKRFVRATGTGLPCGAAQGDAIRNILGSFRGPTGNAGGQTLFADGGIFADDRVGNAGTNSLNAVGTNYPYSRIILDVSATLPTDTENRPVAIAYTPMLKMYGAVISGGGGGVSPGVPPAGVVAATPNTIPLRGPGAEIKVGSPLVGADVVNIDAIGQYYMSPGPRAIDSGSILTFALSTAVPGVQYHALAGATDLPAGKTSTYFVVYWGEDGSAFIVARNPGTGEIHQNHFASGSWQGWKTISPGGGGVFGKSININTSQAWTPTDTAVYQFVMMGGGGGGYNPDSTNGSGGQMIIGHLLLAAGTTASLTIGAGSGAQSGASGGSTSVSVTSLGVRLIALGGRPGSSSGSGTPENGKRPESAFAPSGGWPDENTGWQYPPAADSGPTMSNVGRGATLSPSIVNGTNGGIQIRW